MSNVQQADLFAPTHSIRLTRSLIIGCDRDLVVAVTMAWIMERTFGGTEWWTATTDQIAKETGLTYRQVKRALHVLREKGWIISRRVDKWNPTLEYNLAKVQ